CSMALIMRRNLFARRLRIARHFRAHLVTQRRELILQLIDLRLLAVDGFVELFEQVFSETELGFYLFEARFHGNSRTERTSASLDQRGKAYLSFGSGRGNSIALRVTLYSAHISRNGITVVCSMKITMIFRMCSISRSTAPLRLSKRCLSSPGWASQPFIVSTMP